MINQELFARHLNWAEGRRAFPYEDSVGKLTIGVGRNLDDRGLRESEIEYLLSNDIYEVLAECESLPYFADLDSVRQLVVADMVFNMGLSRFRGFIRTNAALAVHDYAVAANEMTDSKWKRQTGRRAVKLIDAMRSGEWHEEI